MGVKRFLSVVLCVAIMASAFVAVNVNAADVKSDKTLEHCIGLLNALKVTDDIDVLGNADRFVTRGEFATLIARISPIDINAYAGTSSFTDVEGDLAKEAQYACAMGFLKANGSVFNPDGYVNVTEAVKAAVILTGYDVKAKLSGASDTEYMAAASRAKLTDGVDFYTNDKRINLSSLVRLIANILSTPVYEPVSYGTNLVYGKGANLLEVKYGVYNVSGRINANHLSSIGCNTTGYGHVVIGDTDYLVGDTNAMDYLGYEVSAYYRKTDEERTLVYVDTNWFNEIITLDAADVSFSNYTYSYNDGDSRKDKEVQLATDVEVIINGECVVYDETKMVPREGTITLVEANSSKKVTTVIIQDAIVGTVKNYNKSENVMSVSTGDIIDFDLYKEENIKVFDQMDGNKCDVTDIIKDMIVTIFKTDNSITVYTSLVRETGTVSRVSTKSNGVTTIYLNDEAFDVSPYYSDNRGEKAPMVGDTGRFFLDYLGKIAYFKATEDIWNYAYLVAMTKPYGGFERGYMFKLFSDADGGTLLVLDAASKIYVNGVSCAADGKNSAGVDILAGLVNNSQVVKYRVNAVGELKEIEFANDDGVGLEKHEDTKNGFVSIEQQNHTFKGVAAYGNDVKVFIIPNDKDKDGEQWYRMGEYSYFLNSRTYTFEAYKSDATKMLADIIVVKRNEAFVDSKKGGVVTEISTNVSDNGDIVDAVTIMDYNGNETQYVALDSSVIEKVGLYDFVRTNVFKGNVLALCEVLYDYDTDALNPSYEKDLHNGFVMRKFMPLRQEDGYIQINDADVTKYLNAASASVIVCDLTNSRANCYKGSLNDIVDVYSYGIGEEIVAQTRYYIADLIVVYKK